MAGLNFNLDAASPGGLDFELDPGVAGPKLPDSSKPPAELGNWDTFKAKYMSKMVADPPTLIARLADRLKVDPRRIAVREGRPMLLTNGVWGDALPQGAWSDFLAQMAADAPVAIPAGIGAGVSALFPPSIPMLAAGVAAAGAGGAAGAPAKRGLSRTLYDDPTPLFNSSEIAGAGLEGATGAIPGMGIDKAIRRAARFGAGSLFRRLRPEENAANLFLPNTAAKAAARELVASGKEVGRDMTPLEAIPGLRSSVTSMGQAAPGMSGYYQAAAQAAREASGALEETGLRAVMGGRPQLVNAGQNGVRSALEKAAARVQTLEGRLATNPSPVDVAELRTTLQNILENGGLAGDAKKRVAGVLTSLDKEGLGVTVPYTAEEAKAALRAALPQAPGSKITAGREAAEAAAGKIKGIYQAAQAEAKPHFDAADSMGPLDITALRDDLENVAKTGAGGLPVVGAYKRALEKITGILTNDLEGGTKANISQLHQLKEALDDSISSALGGAEPQRKMAKYMSDVKGRLVDFMETSSPDYKKAMDVYRTKLGVKDDVLATHIGRMQDATPEQVLQIFKSADPERVAELSSMIPEHARTLARANLETQLQNIPESADGAAIRKLLLGNEKKQAAMQAADPELFDALNAATKTLAAGRAQPTGTTVGKLHQLLGGQLEDAKNPTLHDLLGEARLAATTALEKASPLYAQHKQGLLDATQSLTKAQEGVLGDMFKGKTVQRTFTPSLENTKAISDLMNKLAIENPKAHDDILYTALQSHLGDAPKGGAWDAMFGKTNTANFWKSATANIPGGFRRLNQLAKAMDGLESVAGALEGGTQQYGRRAEESAAKMTGDPLATLMRLLRQTISGTGREEAMQSRAFAKKGPDVLKALLDPANTEMMLQLKAASKGSRVAARGVTTWLMTQGLEGALSHPPAGEGMNIFEEK